MSDLDQQRLFEMLDPPPGGLTRLRARIRSDRRARIRNRSLAATVATAAAVLLVAVLFLPRGGEPRMLPGLESDLLAVRLGMTEAPSEVVSIRPDLRREYAVQQVPTSDERVVFYMVGSRGAQPPPRPEEASGPGT